MIWMPEHAEGGVRSYLLGFNSEDREVGLQSRGRDPDDVVRNPIKWMQSSTFDSEGQSLHRVDHGRRDQQVRQADKEGDGVSDAQHQRHSVRRRGGQERQHLDRDVGRVGRSRSSIRSTNKWTESTPRTYPSQTRRPNVDYENNIWWGIWAAGKRPGKLAKLIRRRAGSPGTRFPEQNAQPVRRVQDLDGNIWFPDSPTADRSASIGKFNPKDQTFTFYPKPQFSADTPNRAPAVAPAPAPRRATPPGARRRRRAQRRRCRR